MGSGGLARINRHKGRFVSRELNGLWSQSPAIAIDPHLRTRSAVPSHTPFHPITISFGFRFVPLPHIRSTARWLDISRQRGNPREQTVRPSAQTSPQRSGDFPQTCKRVYSALAVRFWSRKSRIYLYVPRVLKQIVIRDLNYKQVTSLRITCYNKYVRRVSNSKFLLVTRQNLEFQFSFNFYF